METTDSLLGEVRKHVTLNDLLLVRMIRNTLQTSRITAIHAHQQSSTMNTQHAHKMSNIGLSYYRR